MTEARENEIALHKVIHGEGPFSYERSPYTVKGNVYYRIGSITRDGWDVLHLVDGSTRNEATIQAIVDILNKRENNETISANVSTQ